MRKFLLSFLTLLATLPALAYDFEIDGIRYRHLVSSETDVEVVANEDHPYSGDVVIPAITGANGFSFNVTSIGYHAFRSCDDLTSISLPESITYIGVEAFDGCSGLTSITIPQSVKEINGYAFSGCTGLTTVTIPEGVIILGNLVFSHCTGLTTAIIKTSAEISRNIFAGCTNLSEIIVDGSNTTYRTIDGVLFNKDATTLVSLPGTRTGSYEVPDGVTTIGDNAFSYCTGITSVTLPKSVTDLGVWAFGYCTGLKTISCEATEPPVCDVFVFEGFDQSAVELLVPAASVEAYKAAETWSKFGSIKAIGSGASVPEVGQKFEVDGIYYLITNAEAKSVAVTFKGETPSDYRIYADDVMIPATVNYNGTTYNVTSISTHAFFDCQNLHSVSIPEGVTDINYYAFDGASNLAGVIIPSTVNVIYGGAFRDCTGLMSITCDATVPPVFEDSYAFTGVDLSAVELLVPAASVEAYKAAETWSKFGSIKAIGSGASVPEVGTEFEIDGIYYKVTDAQALTVEITDKTNEIYAGTFGGIVVPGTVVYEGVTFRVTSIGDRSFTNCHGLISVTLPEGIVNIGESAFWGCSALTSFTIPASVETIEDYAFVKCASLEEFIVADGNRNFRAIDGVLFNKDATVLIVLPGAKEGTYTVPAGVKEIKRCAMAGCSGLTSVTLPEGLTSIGTQAFDWCSNLESINIPASVTTLSPFAFDDCTSLTSAIVIPEGITAISDYLFAGCEKLTSVSLPAGVTYIDMYAFKNCNKLQTIECQATVPPTCSESAFAGVDLSAVELLVPAASVEAYKAADPWSQFGTIKALSSGVDKYFEVDGIWYEVTDAEGRTVDVSLNGSDPSGAYAGDVVIPASVEYAGTTYSVTGIAKQAFATSGDKLTSVSLPEGIKTIKQAAFQNTSELSSIVIPEGVLEIEEDAFENSGISSISLPESLTKIGNYAFFGSNLATVTVPQNVSEIGFAAFGDCGKLMQIFVDEENQYYANTDYGESLTSKDGSVFVAFPAGREDCLVEPEVRIIADGAFYGCSNLTLISFCVNCVTEIGDFAFAYSGLSEAHIPNGVTKVGEYAYVGCLNMTQVSFPSTVTEIGADIFSYCPNLSKIHCDAVIPPSVAGAFFMEGYPSIDFNTCELIVPEDCTDAYKTMEPWSQFANIKGSGSFTVDGLTYSIIDREAKTAAVQQDDNYWITMPHNGDIVVPATVDCNGETYTVTAIGASAFISCAWITSVKLPETITTIGANAFWGCSDLTSFTIPVSVETIEKNAFAYCAHLREFIVPDGNRSFCAIDGVLFNKDATVLITMPAKKEGAYTVPAGVKEIGQSAMAHCYDLTSVNLPEGLTTIGDYAFDYCTNIESINIPGSVTNLGICAFERCYNLSSAIVIPEGITEIPYYLFAWCEKLTSVHIPDGVTKIGDAAFGLTALESVIIPESVTTIEGNAFLGCPLTSVSIPAGVTEIGWYAFMDCDKLQAIECRTTVPPSCGVSVFDGVDKAACELQVPEESIGAYSTTAPWSEFLTIKAMVADGLDTIEAAAARGEAYDLRGMRVAKPNGHGVYIINGKKIRI